ncbi:laminin subunit gamma-2 isoform X2 [Betta splendens]|uniref:Laminin subunit gamma-2 isoform X2 n=1 Tax=Betta splendens TaxID=158456 RepID=A0A6P7L607_BETSP|nr:laminin subunit gamma-2 isoform X2 [Betta splendens]
MRSSWISLWAVVAAVCGVQATYTFYSTARCDCNGRSRNCLRDALGLHCVDCQGNTEGRHCERCRDGFYLEGAGPSCMPCRCNHTGSTSATCDSRGHCSCKDGVTGEKCDRCPEGEIGPSGCLLRREPRQDQSSCFCYGHSSQCSPQSSYSIHNISSTFTSGPDGWKVATAEGVTPQDVNFRWSPAYQDLEVISKNILPVYLYAPAPYLGNQLLSYGQNFSFSLRLDRGVRHPSINDVILEGAGLKVSASLGDLRFIVPCGKKITYVFRLDEKPDSRWRPPLSSIQFQTLLQNITAVKIRATFGENGRGYLDNVQLVSAQHGNGVPARWVQTCSCPLGYEGDFCERCSEGFRRRSPADGAFSPCELCRCRGGSCDPQTGDCYSADETPGVSHQQSCSQGYYQDPWQPQNCVKCPCPEGVPCSVAPGSLVPRCDRCPPGITGSRCDVCKEGFYGDPSGNGGVPRPCRPCQCNGHIDASVAGSCDRSSGECLQCVNNTRGRHCEACVRGFYHRQATDACKPCNCDVLGSESGQCDASGHCQCRPGFQGPRCQRSNCPSCFSPIKAKMEAYASKLKQLERLLSNAAESTRPANSAELEAALREAEKLVDNLQDSTEQLKEMEMSLQTRLSSISQRQLDKGQDIQSVAQTVDDIKQQQKTYNTKVKEVQTLMEEMKLQLEEAKFKLRSAEVPLGDAPQGPDLLSSLVQTASSLAEKHQTKADTVERTANEALSDSEKGLALVRTLMNKENQVKELIGDLKTTYDQTSAQVKGLEKQATLVSSEAKGESRMAENMLKDLVSMERSLPSALTDTAGGMAARLDGLKDAVEENTAGFKRLQGGVQDNRAAVRDWLEKGKGAQQDFNKLLDRVSVAKATTDGALQSINSNAKELEDALDALRGFDQQLDDSRALAAAAIERLPGISGTIQQAASSNAATKSILQNVSGSFSSAQGLIPQLEGAVNSLQQTIGALPSYAGLVNDATKLNEESKALKAKTGDTDTTLKGKLAEARTQEAAAELAAAGATAAFSNAKHTRDAVGKTLRDINALLADMNQPGVVDEQYVKQLEDSLASAQREVELNLNPRFRDMEELEAAMLHRLVNINADIDTVVEDIANLEHILRTVPNGCFNNPPIEQA